MWVYADGRPFVYRRMFEDKEAARRLAAKVAERRRIDPAHWLAAPVD